jgi:hypothetical protein
MDPIESKDLEHNIIGKVKNINNLRMEITNFTRAKEIREEKRISGSIQGFLG